MHNFIIEFQDAFTSHYCEELIEKFESSKSHHLGRTGAGVDVSKKDSLDLGLSALPEWQEDVMHINGVIGKALAQYAKMFPLFLTGAISPSIQDSKTGELRSISHEDVAAMPAQQIEQMNSQMFRFDEINMQRYIKGVGGYHHWHSEHYPHPTDKQQKALHRVLLWLVYLNDVADGGETEFIYQQAKIKPKRGSLVLAPCGFTHSHRGGVPISNDKYVLASWVMYKDSAELYAK